jgi:hypothetical protein
LWLTKNKELKMKTVNKIAIGIAAVLSLGIGITAVQAQQGPKGDMGHMGSGMGPGMMRGPMMQNQMMGQNSDMKVMRELITPKERLSMMDKMMDAKTPQERQAIMISIHAEIEKRAKEKGITLPDGHTPQMMNRKNCG